METTQEMPHAEVGNRVRLIREATGLSQKEFANKHGFNVARYNHWERGFRRISLDCAYVLCDVYGVTLDFIYRGKETALPQSFLKALSSKSNPSA